MLPEVLRCLQTGATVLTPTRRLARYLKAKFDQSKFAQGERAWASADVLTWGAWIDRWVGEDLGTADAGPLLSQAQEDALWHAIVGESDSAHGTGVARLAAQAWELQWTWQIPVSGSSAMGEDVRAYLNWSREFERRCKRAGWMSRAQAADHVASGFARGLRPGSAEVVLYAFDALTPQQTALLRAFEAAGGRVHQMSPVSEVHTGVRVQAVSTEHEFRDIALRAVDVLTARPNARIGVIVTDLSGSRSTISRVFDEVLQPMRVLDCDDSPSPYYNFSLGTALSAQPMLRTILLGVALVNEGLSLAELGELLLSPYWAGGAREFGARAQLDAELRRRGALHWTLDRLQRIAQTMSARHIACPELCRHLQDLHAIDFSGRRRPSQWCEAFKQVLSGLGWPGERALGSTEFQVAAAARETLEKLNLMDVVVGVIPCAQARAMLARLFAAEIFQPETPDAPIQVMGVLESAGIEFDHLTVAGMHADAWPAPYQVNPLLPVSAQRARNLPHSSPEWELQFATRMMRSWSSCARELVYSHAAENDGEARRASKLTLALPAGDAVPSSAWTSYAGRMYRDRVLESASLEPAIPLSAAQHIRGGASVLRDQAACPFRAFALHRLSARALESGRIGLDARERGTLLHEALRGLYTHSELATLLDLEQPASRDAAIDRAVNSALDDMARRRPDVVTDGFRLIEAQRLAQLLRSLLDLESLRLPFRVIACETPRELQVGGLRLNGRLDRVDELVSESTQGNRVLIDYKTGETSIRGWFGERPDQPQLPLYAISESDSPRALLLLQINADKVKYVGLSAVADAAPGVLTAVDEKIAGERVESWDALLAYWRRMLDRLAQDFLAGRHDVDPKNGSDTCRHCELPLLCRIAPEAARPLVDSDGDLV